MSVRLGRWQDVLEDVECDAAIFDGPYSERVHRGHNAGVKRNSTMSIGGGRPIDYGFLTPDDVHEVVSSWSPRTRGWIVSITSHDLIPHWEDALNDAGRYVFPPLPLIDPRKGRIPADGPASWAVYLVVARPKTREMAKWGALPAFYKRERGEPRGTRMGGKPLGVMRRIVCDYSRPDDLVCDPFAGLGTTLLAAEIEGRRGIGAEIAEDAHAAAVSRLACAPTLTDAGLDGGTLALFG